MPASAGGRGSDTPPAGQVGRAGVLFEIRCLGNSMRVAAIDAETRQEVVVFGPANARVEALQQLALRKLTRARTTEKS